MTSRKSRRRFDRPLAASLGPDDGIDPREWSRDSNPLPVRNRKALQLCRQVELALHMALACCGDPVLQELDVIDVRPAPDSSRLLVRLHSEVPPTESQSRLRAASGLLRRDVALAIHRRKTPELIFEVLAIDR